VRIHLPESQTVSMLINARIQTDAAKLSVLMEDILTSVEKTYSCSITTENSAVFTPGYPVPTHRDT
jgi:hypothetical protein